MFRFGGRVLAPSFSQFIIITLCLAVAISVSTLPAQTQSNQPTGGLRTTDAPSKNLPNLDTLRDRKEQEVRKPEPLPATRCRHWDKKCKKEKGEKDTGQVFQNDKNSFSLTALNKAFDWRSSLVSFDSNAKAGTSQQPKLDTVKTARLERWRQSLPKAFASSLLPAMAFQTYSNAETARVEPQHRTGTPGEDLLSGNFNFNIPIVSLPGRAGHDLNLTLAYNSKVWVKSSNYSIRFDMDYGWPSPGFRLGFPTFYGPYVNSTTNRNSFGLILPTGAAVELRQVSGLVETYDAEDGSYIRLKHDLTTGNYILTMPNGTQYIYGATLDIKDRNGNLITATYNVDGQMDTITDTLGRQILFQYGSFYELQKIQQVWNGLPKDLVTFDYDSTYQLMFRFTSGLVPDNVVNMQTVPVMYQMTLLDNSRYKFQYNTYGQVNRYEKYGGLTFLRAWTQYNLPTYSDGTTQSGCPGFTTRTDWAYEWSAPGGVVSSFQFNQTVANPDAASETANPNLICGQVTTPDGTTYKEFYYGLPATSARWRYGLLKMAETWTDSNTNKRKMTKAQYEQPCGGGTIGNWLAQCNPRVTESNIYDNSDGNNSNWENQRRTIISYAAGNPTDFNLPADVYEYDYPSTATVLRRTHTDYNQTSTYINKRIIGLPSASFLYDGANVLYSKVEYLYDESGSLQAHTTTPIQRDTTNYGIGYLAGRANLTTIRRYNINDNTYVEAKTGYYITGTVAFAKDALNHQTTFDYADGFCAISSCPGQTLQNKNSYAYPTKVTDPDNYSSFAYYDFNVGAAAKTIDPKGATVLREFDGYGRMWRTTNQVNGAYTRWDFDPNQYFVKSYSTIQDGLGEFYAITVFDGHGRVRAAVSDHPGSTGQYRGVYNVYDSMGRQSQVSNPTEINSTWTPAGDDVVNGSNGGWRWSLQSYDWQGRPLVTTNTDATTKSASYTGCGCAGGQVATLTDETGRKQNVYSDALGRNFKTETLQLVGSTWNVYSTQLVTFNVRDQITQSSLIVGTNGASQSGTNQYDGHGRLWKNKSPLQTTDTIYEYFGDDTLKKVTDARLAVVNYLYNNRKLVTDITYDTPPNNPQSSDPLYVAPAQPVHFTYDSVGGRLTMADGIGSVAYVYDSLSRLQSETRTITEINKSYSLTYGYNLAGQVTQINFVSPSFPADNVTTDYQRDKAGQLTGITGAPFAGTAQYASQVKYRAFGGLKTLTYGNSHSTNATYNSRLQLQSLDVKRSDNVAIANKTYAYYSDNRLKYSSDPLHPDFARAYQYDHAGRLTESWTGTQATNFFNGVPIGNSTVPYHQAFTYDVWGNRLTNMGKIWSYDVTETETYNAQTLRHDGWQYDNAGNVVKDSLSQLQYDVAGRSIAISQGTPVQGVAIATQAMDGDGMVVRQDPNSNVPRFFINSSVLGGKVIAEVIGVDGPPTFLKGERTDSYVYFGETRIATQNIHPTNGLQAVYWNNIDPLTGTKMQFFPNEATVNRLEPDSQTINVDLVDPATLPPPQFEPEEPSYSGIPPSSGAYDPTKPIYIVDGVRREERFALNLLQTGGGGLDPNYLHDIATLNRAGILGHWERKVVPRPTSPSFTPGPLSMVMGSYDVVHSFVVDSIGFGLASGQQDGNNKAGTVNELKNSIYSNKNLLDKINKCLKSLLGDKFSEVGEQTSDNAPKVNTSLTSAQIKAKMTGVPAYGTWVPTGVTWTWIPGKTKKEDVFIRNGNGIIYIAKEVFNNPSDWKENGRYGPGRSTVQNVYVHELGNMASYFASKGKSYTLFGVKGAWDDDSGYALQSCVFDEPVKMK